MHGTPGHDGQSDVESKKCKKIQLKPTTYFPGPKVMFTANEKVRQKTGEENMEAARRLACVLSAYNLPGFGDVLKYLKAHQKQELRNWYRKRDDKKDTTVWECKKRNLAARVRDALCIIADPDIVPPSGRKAASKCGGVRPGQDGYGPRKFDDEWQDWADPGNKVYDEVINHVISQTKNAPIHPARQSGLDHIKTLNPGHRADIIEAYLGAADAAVKLEEHMQDKTLPWLREYKAFPGGIFSDNDEVAQYISNKITDIYQQQGILPLSKKEKKKAAAKSRVS